MADVKIIECPRDAMQGLHDFIPTDVKASYINTLLKCGFDTLDFGSFVSPKAIPQMRDTADVLSKLDLSTRATKLLAIVANERGAEEAVQFEEIDFLGYPFSVSEEFQKRNTNATIEESLGRVEAMQNLCVKNKKQLVVYLSMGFGNPYGEVWNAEVVYKWCNVLFEKFDIRIQALSDTIGAANPALVESLFKEIIPALPTVEIGAHLHTRPENAQSIVSAAFSAGCLRFDGALKGFGGCPMAKDDLTGNMPTEIMLDWFRQNGISTGIDRIFLDKALEESKMVFPM